MSAKELSSLKEDNSKLKKLLLEQRKEAKANATVLADLKSGMESVMTSWSQERRKHQQELERCKQEMQKAHKVGRNFAYIPHLDIIIDYSFSNSPSARLNFPVP
jgi:ABC-type cobalamin/Fe3+-siderophores transport system ATPase subunit